MPDLRDRGITIFGRTVHSTCAFKNITTLDCPLCGITRSMVCAVRGKTITAIEFHPLGPAVLAYFLMQILFRAGRLLGLRLFLNTGQVSRRLFMAPTYLVLGLLASFWAVRTALSLAEIIFGP